MKAKQIAKLKAQILEIRELLNIASGMLVQSDLRSRIELRLARFQATADRKGDVKNMRENDKMTFSEIGKTIGVCAGTARVIYEQTKRMHEIPKAGITRETTIDSLCEFLSARACNVIYGSQWKNVGEIVDNIGKLQRLRNCGSITQFEIRAFLKSHGLLP